ncbi:MAG: hypothetical protein IBJ03_07530 [Gemmatimonadaceae bacterium]|nr:hypothetical protein [Gemmatimonadaceae bacterium]
MRRRQGGGWARIEVPTSESLYGVHGTSAVDVVIVGLEGTVLRWNGTLWTVVGAAALPGGFYGVVGSSSSNGRRYIVGDGGVAQLEGSVLTAVSTPYAPRMYGISLDNTGTVWTGGQRGAVLRSGTPWTTLNIAPDLLDVWSTSASNSFAVGEFGFAYRWNGSSWSRLNVPTQETLNSVWAVNGNEAFAGGDNGTMLRWNGTTWTAMTFPSGGHVYSLWGTAANNVYATTSRGEILRWNGTTWTVAATTSSSMWSVYGASANSVIATGENGVVMRWNGTAWTQLAAPTNGTLAGVWLTGLADVYSVGTDASGAVGAAFSYDGSTWRSMTTGSSRVLTSVWGPSVNDLYATGDVGTLLRYSGMTWSTISTGTTDLLWAISASPDATGAAFAVGYNSTIVAGTNAALRAGVMAVTAPDGVSRASLEPTRGAKLRRGPLPSHGARGLPGRTVLRPNKR